MGFRDLKEYDAMGTLHLNSHVRKRDGFAPFQRVIGRTPKMPIGSLGNPHFKHFMFRSESPATHANDLVKQLISPHQSSSESGFRGKFNLALVTRFRDMVNEQFLLCVWVGGWGGPVFRTHRNNKINRKENGLARVSL